MGRAGFSSHSRYHPLKKRTVVSYQNPTLQTPSSPNHPGTDTGEDPHEHRLIGAYHYDTCIHLCPYTPYRRCRGVGRVTEGNHSLTPVRVPSRASVPHSLPWRRVAHLPSDSPKSHCSIFFIPPTRVPKRLTTGWLINLLTSFTQPTK